MCSIVIKSLAVDMGNEVWFSSKERMHRDMRSYPSFGFSMPYNALNAPRATMLQCRESPAVE